MTSVRKVVKYYNTEFLYFEKGIMYYWIVINNTICKYPVHISDIDSDVLGIVHRAYDMRKYIRLALKNGTLVKLIN